MVTHGPWQLNCLMFWQFWQIFLVLLYNALNCVNIILFMIIRFLQYISLWLRNLYDYSIFDISMTCHCVTDVVWLSTVGCFPESRFLQFSVAQVLVVLQMQFINNLVFPTWACAAGFNINNKSKNSSKISKNYLKRICS